MPMVTALEQLRALLADPGSGDEGFRVATDLVLEHGLLTLGAQWARGGPHLRGRFDIAFIVTKADGLIAVEARAIGEVRTVEPQWMSVVRCP